MAPESEQRRSPGGQTQEQHRQSKRRSEEVTIQSMLSSHVGFWAPWRGHRPGVWRIQPGPLSSCMMQGTGPTKKL